VCGATSCNLELIKPTCPPYDPNVYVCVCGVSSCQLQLITTTSRPTGGVTAPCPGRTIGTTPGNYQYDCTGKPDGNYEDPFDFCSGGFYMCTNGEAEYFVIIPYSDVLNQFNILSFNNNINFSHVFLDLCVAKYCF
jgi:hypothetical protein